MGIKTVYIILQDTQKQLFEDYYYYIYEMKNYINCYKK